MPGGYRSSGAAHSSVVSLGTEEYTEGFGIVPTQTSAGSPDRGESLERRPTTQQPPIETQADYYVPLLRVLAEFPNGTATPQEAVERFWLRYGAYIPPELQEPLESHPETQKWQHNVHWARHKLRTIGYIEMPRHGFWKLSDEGHIWLESHPDAHYLDTATVRRGRRSRRTSQTRGSRSTSRTEPASVLPAITLDMLERTREMMGEESFRQLWGTVYDQLMAAERLAAVTKVSEHEIGRRAWQHLQTIHAFLQGRNEQMPTSEMLCDWIHYCYILELHREVVVLWKTVQPTSVNQWQYERTQRIVRASQARLGR